MSNQHDYIHGQLKSDIEHIKEKVDIICEQPEVCSKKFIKRWHGYVIAAVIVTGLVTWKIIPSDVIAAFIP